MGGGESRVASKYYGRVLRSQWALPVKPITSPTAIVIAHSNRHHVEDFSAENISWMQGPETDIKDVDARVRIATPHGFPLLVSDARMVLEKMKTGWEPSDGVGRFQSLQATWTQKQEGDGFMSESKTVLSNVQLAGDDSFPIVGLWAPRNGKLEQVQRWTAGTSKTLDRVITETRSLGCKKLWILGCQMCGWEFPFIGIWQFGSDREIIIEHSFGSYESGNDPLKTFLAIFQSVRQNVSDTGDVGTQELPNVRFTKALNPLSSLRCEVESATRDELVFTVGLPVQSGNPEGFAKWTLRKKALMEVDATVTISQCTASLVGTRLPSSSHLVNLDKFNLEALW